MQNDTITRLNGAHPSDPVDWETIAEITPSLVHVFCWLLWLAFLLAPTLFNLHHTHLFSTANNVVFVLMGLVLCLAVGAAIRSGHGGRAVFFALGLSLLSFWF